MVPTSETHVTRLGTLMGGRAILSNRALMDNGAECTRSHILSIYHRLVDKKYCLRNTEMDGKR